MRSGGRRSSGLLVILTAVLGFVAAVVWGRIAESEGRPSLRSAFRIAPYLQNASPDGVTIMWEAKEPGASRVEYWVLGKKSEGGVSIADDAVAGVHSLPMPGATPSRAGKIHKVRISGLKPDTRYGYRVRRGMEVREGDFATAPLQSRPIRFAVLGDSRFWKDYWQTTPLPQHLLSRKPEFILHMGDLVGNGLRYGEWEEHFARFESVLGRVPMFPARGNHERDGSEDPQNDWFARYHELPGGEPYSSFDWGNSHFAIVSFTHISECASFLDADFRRTKKKWKFVAFHHPVYCTGYDSPTDKRKATGNPELEAIFDEHGVDIVFSGHTHIYERSFPIRRGKRDDRKGTVYLVQGGAVGGNYPDSWTATIARDLSYPHYTFVEVGDDKIELRSYGLAKGDERKRGAARIIEIDHYVRWRNEELPRRVLSEMPSKQGQELLEAIENLGAMCYGPAAQAMLPYLRHKDTAVREAAALSLERIANPDVSGRLVPSLRDNDLVVRRRVARALEAATLPEVADKIVPEILGPAQDSQVRVCLLGALLHHAPGRAFSVAMKALGASDGPVRDRAADVIKRTATQNDAAVLTGLLRDEKRPYVAGCLAWGINRLKGDKPSLERQENSTKRQ